MGMYDIIEPDVANSIIDKCPFCGKEFDEEEWQTKSFDNSLKILELEDVVNESFEMHTICNFCRQYIELEVISKIEFKILKTNYNKEE